MRKYFIPTFAIIFFTTSLFAQVKLNEIVYDPTTGNADGSSTAGEWIELYGTAGTDIGCYVITDGDWAITIPDGTTIPADGFFVIGKATYANMPGGNGTTAVDLDVETCGCTVGSNVMELTNTGEFVGLYDVAATPMFVDGVIYESPTTGNQPANESAINSAAITGCVSVSVDIPNSAASYASVGGGNDVAIARASDGAGAWGYLDETEVTPNATNSSGLPIELKSFEVIASNGNAELKWSTDSELNNDHFLIEHSFDANAFEVIGRVDGAGTVSIQQMYNFTHRDISNGIHYYRLKQVDYDGKSDYSQIISIKMYGEGEVRVFPTVVQKSFTIEVGTSFETDTSFEIFDISGRKIKNGIFLKNKNSFQINSEDWNQGHYFVKISQKGHQTIHRIIK